MEERFYKIRYEAENEFLNGDFDEARKLALKYLEMADSFQHDWNYGNAVHHANLILGRVALKEGNIEKAKEYLLKAGDTPGSPQISSFGPNMMLAKELLEQGEKATVLAYFSLCKIFWIGPQASETIEKWGKEVKGGVIPAFKAHLIY